MIWRFYENKFNIFFTLPIILAGKHPLPQLHVTKEKSRMFCVVRVLLASDKFFFNRQLLTSMKGTVSPLYFCAFVIGRQKIQAHKQIDADTVPVRILLVSVHHRPAAACSRLLLFHVTHLLSVWCVHSCFAWNDIRVFSVTESCVPPLCYPTWPLLTGSQTPSS
jgi:hypothetical protein